MRERKARRKQITDPVGFLYRRLSEEARAEVARMEETGSPTALAVRVCNYLSNLLAQRLWLSQQELQVVRRYVVDNLPDAA